MHRNVFRERVALALEQMLKPVPQRIEEGAVMHLGDEIGPEVCQDGRQLYRVHAPDRRVVCLCCTRRVFVVCARDVSSCLCTRDTSSRVGL